MRYMSGFRFATIIPLMLVSALVAQEAAEDSTRAFLSVVSSTPGFELFVDGKLRGRTPVTALPILPGEHTVLIRRTTTNNWMMTDWIRKIHVEARDSVVLHAQLLLPYLIKSTPFDADVFVDNVHKGKTPLIIELPDTSTHRVTVIKEGYRPAEVVCSPSGDRFLHLTLVPERSMASQQQILLAKARSRKTRYGRRALLFTGLTIASGVAAILLSNHADDLYQQYLEAGDPQKRERYFDRTETFDTYSSLAMGAFQINLALSLYYFYKSQR